MKITTGTARRLLREVNPVPDDAFGEAARDLGGQALLTDILDSSVAPVMPREASRWRVLAGRTRPRWRVVIPASAMTAALAAGLAIALLVTGESSPASPFGSGQAANGVLATLVANLTAHPAARQGDASAELRELAGIAAAQPAPAALGPVEYSRAESWGLDLGTTHYGLGYVSHQTNLDESWIGSDGASLEVRTWPGGKVPQGNIPVDRTGPSAQGKARFSQWYSPATLPTSESLMRQHLLGMSCPAPGACYGGGNPTSEIVTSAQTLMGSEPLPPAARAAILRVLADTAAHPGSHQAFYDLGSVTDRAGHKAVAIAYEAQSAAPTQTQGGSASGSCTTTTSNGRTTVSCGFAGKPSGTARASSTPSPTPSSTSPSPSPSAKSTTTQGWSGAASFMESSLVVLVFDPDTGALLGVEYAYCNAPVEAHLATGSCFGTSYDQILQIKAVPSIPATPTAP
ncbi:MAG TPA: hypothetical protein VI365_32525, partial [Trebonia sp.]